MDTHSGKIRIDDDGNVIVRGVYSDDALCLLTDGLMAALENPQSIFARSGRIYAACKHLVQSR